MGWDNAVTRFAFQGNAQSKLLGAQLLGQKPQEHGIVGCKLEGLLDGFTF